MEPQTYRKKETLIEAIQFTPETKDRCFNFVTCNKSADFGEDDGKGNAEPILRIYTNKDSYFTARMGEWIIKKQDGYWAMSHEVFSETFELVEEPTTNKEDTSKEKLYGEMLGQIAIEVADYCEGEDTTLDAVKYLKSEMISEHGWANHYCRKLVEAQNAGYLPDNFKF